MENNLFYKYKIKSCKQVTKTTFNDNSSEDNSWNFRFKFVLFIYSEAREMENQFNVELDERKLELDMRKDDVSSPI